MSDLLDQFDFEVTHSYAHQHTPSRVHWNWATDRIEHWCSCGLKLADDYDKASYGTADCGQSWQIDLALGFAVAIPAFLILLALLVVLA